MQAAIDIFSVSDRDDLNDVVTVINVLQDSVGTDPQTILFQAPQFEAAVRSGVGLQRTNRLGDPIKD
jgi:hypothetical protein